MQEGCQMRYKIGANVVTVHIQCYQKLMQHVIRRRLQMYTVIRITFFFLVTNVACEHWWREDYHKNVTQAQMIEGLLTTVINFAITTRVNLKIYGKHARWQDIV